MDIFTFLGLITIGYFGIMFVLGSLIWCAVWLWRRLTGRSLAVEDIDNAIQHRHHQTGMDADREHAAQALRSHPGPPPFP